MIAGGVDAWTAYKAATASYWMGTALGTGGVVSGASYTGSAAFSAWIDPKFGTGQSFGAGFEQRFSYPGLSAAISVGALTGMYSTAMFSWAGVPNAFGNWATLPGAVIRINSIAMGQAGGRATQAVVNENRKQRWMIAFLKVSCTGFLEVFLGLLLPDGCGGLSTG